MFDMFCDAPVPLTAVCAKCIAITASEAQSPAEFDRRRGGVGFVPSGVATNIDQHPGSVSFNYV